MFFHIRHLSIPYEHHASLEPTIDSVLRRSSAQSWGTTTFLLTAPITASYAIRPFVVLGGGKGYTGSDINRGSKLSSELESPKMHNRMLHMPFFQPFNQTICGPGRRQGVHW
jgi:hypothetical protein